jgi:phospholipid N-methyltransferase
VVEGLRAGGPLRQDAGPAAERARILAEYQRRGASIGDDLYAPWRPEVSLGREGRTRLAAELLRKVGRFPGRTTPCLEVGCGDGGWLPDLLAWGVSEKNLVGLELDAGRFRRLRERMPAVHRVVGDAAEEPFRTGTFGLIVVSTVFSSILDPDVRVLVARGIAGSLSRTGALVVYDIAHDNPSNGAVRRVTHSEVIRLFPCLHGTVRSLTLAPPLSRRIAPLFPLAARVLEAIPALRSHLLAVFTTG